MTLVFDHLLDHLWQSTLFGAVAALLALGLRKNHARARHWLWLAASVKFLVPFSVLVSLGSSVGSNIGWRTVPSISLQPVVTIVIDQISLPFVQVSSAASASTTSELSRTILLAVWLIGCAVVVLHWFRRWLPIRGALRAATPIQLSVPIRAFSSPTLIEPGVFGIFRPVLLLPAGIEERLTPAQLQSILAHEMCHVRRRDNLAAAVHMLTEATFWFHPLVWWIGARLVEERERACDEEVLRSGNEPVVYAESILQVCRHYLESPLECAAGVTGSNLKKRIETIMGPRVGRSLSPWRKLALALAGVGSLAAPLTIGAINAVVNVPQVRAQSEASRGFEVASIKPSDPAARGSGIPPAVNGRFRAVNVPVRELVGYVYQTANRSRISGGPSWVDSERFDIEAKAAENLPEAKIRPMVLKLLEDRFALKFHHEQRQLPAYVMSVAKGGLKLKVSDTCIADPEKKRPCGGFRVQNRSYIGGQQVSTADFAEVLEALLDEPIIDRTGIKGVFNMTLQWTPDERTPSGGDVGVPPVNPETPSLFVAMQEQLGLKLDRQKTAVDVVVIDSAQRPAAN
jgi:bla regulator protein blaR1